MAVQTQAEAILRLEMSSDFVLVGHSSGGWFAHGAASLLEAEGRPPAAVVLIDTFFPATGRFLNFAPETLAKMWTEQNVVHIDDARLTAMAFYMRSFAEWTPPEIETPISVIRPSEPHPALNLDDPDDWRGSWPPSNAGVEVPGDHFSMMVTHAETTAQAIRTAIGLEALDEQPKKG
jgi:thioesterase domain-containing protein